MSDNKFRILITGTSSGFGKLAAETLARAGHDVYAGMRNPNGRNASARDELSAVKLERGSIHVLDLDVTRDDSVNAAVASVDSRAGGIDVLINNAGVLGFGFLETFTLENVQALYDVNVFGALRMNRAVLPIMHRQNKGLLMHVTSSAGRLVFPFMGAYASSKFALEAIAEGYHYELSQTGIESIIVQPGSFATKVSSNKLAASDASRANPYAALAPLHAGMLGMLESGETDPNAPNPQAVADAMLQLVNSQPGTRPLRTIVDVHFAPFMDSINRASSEAQTQVLGAMGMGNLVAKGAV